MHRVVLEQRTQENGGKAAIPQSEFLVKEDLKTLYTVRVLGCSLQIIKKLNKNIRFSFLFSVVCCPRSCDSQKGAWSSLKPRPREGFS